MAVGDTVNGKRVWGEAKRFQVFNDGTFSGPAEYVKQIDHAAILRQFDLLCQAAPSGTSVYQIYAVTLQTDYAAWLGTQEMLAWSHR